MTREQPVIVDDGRRSRSAVANPLSADVSGKQTASFRELIVVFVVVVVVVGGGGGGGAPDVVAPAAVAVVVVGVGVARVDGATS